MPALTIFEHSIRYLKDHCLNSLKNRLTELDESDIQYVLTVPAIWDDKAKIFMRRAAIQAGIPSVQLRMALEPEAASLWCQVESEKEYMDIGRKYMVVDLGGGTADITVNEQNDDGTLNELHKATGGAWGGTEVDKNFEHFLCQIYGGDVVEELKDKDMGDYFNILRSFETKKRSMKSDNAQRVVIWIPATMRDIVCSKGRDIHKNISASGLDDRCEFKGDKLKVETSIVQDWFKGPIDSVTNHLRGLFAWSDINEVESILLVGGFAESKFIQEPLRAAFPDKIVIVPSHDADLVVLKGAVKFGHFPELIAARKSKCNYGVDVVVPFDPAKHDKERRCEIYGKVYCDGIFGQIVARHESIPYGHRFKYNLRPLSKEQTEVSVSLYASERENTYFCDDEGCRKIGEIEVHVPASESQSERGIKVYISFWDTEIKLQVEICKTGHRYEERFDHL